MKAEWKTLVGRFPAREVSGAGRRFSYRRAGRGPDLVLLHGIGSGSASWVHQLAHFQDRHRVTAWDAPGYGGSDPLDRAEPVAQDYAQALGAFLEALAIDRAVIVGHSLGAMMAAAFAAAPATAWAGELGGLVLAAPALGFARAAAKIRQRELADRLSSMKRLGPEGLAKARSPAVLSADATPEALALVQWNMARLTVAGYAAAVHLLVHGDLARDAARADLPMLVVCGDADTVTPPDQSRSFAEALPAAEYKEISGAGHACYIERPAEFNRLLGAYAQSRA